MYKNFSWYNFLSEHTYFSAEKLLCSGRRPAQGSLKSVPATIFIF
jgi:hypothetical protein